MREYQSGQGDHLAVDVLRVCHQEMLEQLASGPAELSFQIRQQSEGVGGRVL